MVFYGRSGLKGRIPKTQILILDMLQKNPSISNQELADKLGISKKTVKLQRHMALRNIFKIKQYCPNCFAFGSRVKCAEGYVCQKCGVVFEESAISIANEKFWRQPINALHWNFNKGLDGNRERRLLMELRKQGIIKDLTTWELSKIPIPSIDDGFTRGCLGWLQVKFHDDDWALTHAAGLLLRQKIKKAKYENELLTETLREKLVKETLDEIHKIVREAKLEEDEPKAGCDEINYGELLIFSEKK